MGDVDHMRRAWWSIRGVVVQLLALGAGLGVGRLAMAHGHDHAAPIGLMIAVLTQILLTPLVPSKRSAVRRRIWLSPFWSTLALGLLGAVIPVLWLLPFSIRYGIVPRIHVELFLHQATLFTTGLFGFSGYALGRSFGSKAPV